MKYSLISRDWIADCIEIMHEAYSAVSIGGGACITLPWGWGLYSPSPAHLRMPLLLWEVATRQVSGW